MSLHKHHIIPKHAGGNNDPLNITPPISKRLHAMFHYDRWKVLKAPEDLAACKLLLGLITSDDARRVASIEGRRIALSNMTSEERRQRWGKGRGQKASEETRCKMRIAHIGRVRKPMSEEAKQKISLTKKASGWRPSVEHKAKVGAAALGNTHRKGTKLTEDHKMKLRRPNPAVSESNRRRVLSKKWSI